MCLCFLPRLRAGDPGEGHGDAEGDEVALPAVAAPRGRPGEELLQAQGQLGFPLNLSFLLNIVE